MIEIKRTNGTAFGSVQSPRGHEKMGQKCDIFSAALKRKSASLFTEGGARIGAWIAACGRYSFSRPKSFIFLNRVRLSIPRLSAVGPRFQLFFFKAFSR